MFRETIMLSRFFHIDIIMSETEQFLPLFFVDQKLKLPSKLEK